MEELNEYNSQIEQLTNLLATITDDKEYDMVLMKINHLKSLRNALENRILRINYSELLLETIEKISELDENDLEYTYKLK